MTWTHLEVFKETAVFKTIRRWNFFFSIVAPPLKTFIAFSQLLGKKLDSEPESDKNMTSFCEKSPVSHHHLHV